MRANLDFDNSKNKHIAKLKKLYDINPRFFFLFLDLLLHHEWKIGQMEFSPNTEFLHLPDHEKIYTPYAFQPVYHFYVLDNHKILSNAEELKKHIDFITHEKHFSHILVITSNKDYQKLKTEIELYLPEKTDEITYTIGIVSNHEFDIIYKDIAKQAVKDTLEKLKHIL